MLDHHDTGARVGQTSENLDDLSGSSWVELCEGLIQEKKTGTPRNGCCDDESLLLTSG